MRIFKPLTKKNHRFLVLALTAVLVLVLGGKALAAWGPSRPTYTWAHPADHITFNSITDNPTIGDERYFAHAKTQNEATFHDPVTGVKDGDVVAISVYFHNNAGSNLNLKAKNTRVSILLPDPSKVQTSTFASAQISADNATPKAVWDTVDISGTQPFSLEYVKGSARLVNGVFTASSGGTQLGDNVVTENGTLVGFNKIDGVVPGCSEFSGYVNINVRVHVKPKEEKTPKFACDLLTLDAKPNRKVNATVKFSASGGATFKDVNFNWGDNTTPLMTTNTSASHTYAKDGTYTVKATLDFNIGSTTQQAICSAPITFTTPPPPNTPPPSTPPSTPPETPPAPLPNTGPGSVAAIFTGVTTFAGAFHYMWNGRKLRNFL